MTSTPTPARAHTARSRDRQNDGQLTGRVARLLGRPLMPWQRRAAMLIGERAGAGYAYPLVIITVPRQSGKTYLMQCVMTARALACADRRVWYTAQTGDMASRRWEDLAGMIGSSPLDAAVERVLRAAAAKKIRFTNRSFIRAFAPTTESLHSETTDLVVVDEAWSFSRAQGAELMQAVIPSQQTRPARQLIICSTAGDEHSTWLADLVDTGRKAAASGATASVAFIDYGCPPGLDPEDESGWASWHPAIGHTIDAAALRAARAAPGMDGPGFARAYGNIAPAAGGSVDMTRWQKLARPVSRDGAPAGIGVDIAHDRSGAAIYAAWRPDADEGPVAIGLVEAGPGVAWLAPRLETLAADRTVVRIAINPAGPAMTLVAALGLDTAVRDRFTLTPARSYAAACAGLRDRISAGTLIHPPDPELDLAVAAASTRTLGEGWAWDHRRSTVSIAPLTAATLAVHALLEGPSMAPPMIVTL